MDACEDCFTTEERCCDAADARERARTRALFELEITLERCVYTAQKLTLKAGARLHLVSTELKRGLELIRALGKAP